jgi:hypothetical protein
MRERRLTEPQRKALLWLVPGKVCGDAPRSVSAALSSLHLYHRDLVSRSLKKTERDRSAPKITHGTVRIDTDEGAWGESYRDALPHEVVPALVLIIEELLERVRHLEGSRRS